MDSISQHGGTVAQKSGYELKHKQQQVDDAAHHRHPINAALACGGFYSLL